jgi:hypothetical protein
VTQLRLRGSAAARATALDRLLLLGQVAAVLEGDDAVDVAVRDAWPRLDDIAGLDVEVLPPPAPDAPPITGLETDALIRVADDLIVRPPWVAPLDGFDGVELIVPRGGAFGSGEHGSTQAALLALHAAWPDDAAGLAFIDVGTGSGILAAYAQQRGVRRLMACDVEAPAARAARELLGPGADVRRGGPELWEPGCADLVVANLDAQQLADNLAGIIALWSGRSVLVLSGTRRDEVDVVRGPLGEPIAAVERGGFVAQVFGSAALERFGG